MVSKRLTGLLSFSVGGTILMFVLHFIVQNVYVSVIWDWAGFIGWMSLFSFVGFLLFGYGLMQIVKQEKQNPS